MRLEPPTEPKPIEQKPAEAPAAPAAVAAAAPSKDITREATRAATANDAAAKAEPPKDNAANAVPPVATEAAKTDVRGDVKAAAAAPPAKPKVPAATVEERKAAVLDVPRTMAKDAAKVEQASKDNATDGVKDLVKADVPSAARPAAPSAQSGDNSTGTVVVKPVVTTLAHPVEVQKTFVPPAAPTAPVIAAPAVAAPVPAACAAPAPVPASRRVPIWLRQRRPPRPPRRSSRHRSSPMGPSGRCGRARSRCS